MTDLTAQKLQARECWKYTNALLDGSLKRAKEAATEMSFLMQSLRGPIDIHTGYCHIVSAIELMGKAQETLYAIGRHYRFEESGK